MCLNNKSDKGCTRGDKCHFPHVKAEGEPNKKSKKSGVAGSVALLKESIQSGCVSQDSYPRNLFHVKKENWDQNTPSNSPRAPGTESKFRKETVHREVLSQSVRLMSVVRARQNSRTDHMRRPRTKNDAPAKQRGIGENIFKLKNSDKAAFHVPGEVKGMSTPVSSKRPEEREFLVDSGASMHMMSKNESSSQELWTVDRSRTPAVV